MDKAHKTSLLKGTYKHSENEVVDIQLSVYIFKEDEFTIAYCPALDLSGYGNNEDEANVDFKAVLAEYFNYTISKKTIRQDLQELGWVIKKSMHKKMIPPTDEQIMRTNESFNHIMTTYPVRKVNTPIQIPAFA